MDDSRSGDNATDLALALVGYNKEVLGVGSASTSLIERLERQGCTVSVVDMDVGVWHGAKDESFDVVLLTDALAGSPDPLRALGIGARKLKPSGVLVAWLPNATHGDTRIAVIEGRFHYGGRGLLDGSQVGQFTLEAIRDLFMRAGLVIVDTARVIAPLIEPQFGVIRDEARPEGLYDLMEDPEIESYEFVLRAVRDNGDRALVDLARRVDELADRARDETARTALLRSEMWQMELLSVDLEQHRKLVGEQQQAIANQQQYIEALSGHVSGLENNLEALTQELGALRQSHVTPDAKFKAILGRRSVHATAPIRWFSDKLTRNRKNS
jgi:hypothetical protein